MIYLTNEDRRREALAQEGAQALAAIAGWQTEACPVILPPQLTGYLYCPTANLVLAHWRKDISIGRLLAATRETRLDIMLVEPAWIGSAWPAFGVSLILCRNGDTNLYCGLRLWSADIDGPAWLVPDSGDRDLDHRCFDLNPKRVTPSDEMPFANHDSRDNGLLTGKIRWQAIVGGHLV